MKNNLKANCPRILKDGIKKVFDDSYDDDDLSFDWSGFYNAEPRRRCWTTRLKTKIKTKLAGLIISAAKAIDNVRNK